MKRNHYPKASICDVFILAYIFRANVCLVIASFVMIKHKEKKKLNKEKKRNERKPMKK